LKIPKTLTSADSKKSREKKQQNKTKTQKTQKFQQEAASKKLNIEMNIETIRQLLKANSKVDYERNEAARKEDRDLLSTIVTTIDDISKDVKGIKDDVKNLERRVSDTEKTLSNIENTAITREELGEIQRRRSELVIFGLPELAPDAQNDLKNDVFTELNKVTRVSLEEIKYVKKFGKPNGKIRPTLVVLNGAAKRDTIIEEARRVSPNIQPNLTKQQQQFKKKLKDEIKEKNSKAGCIVCKIAGPSDAPFILPTKDDSGGFQKVMKKTINTSYSKQK
jgi:hypothetical protein